MKKVIISERVGTQIVLAHRKDLSMQFMKTQLLLNKTFESPR